MVTNENLSPTACVKKSNIISKPVVFETQTSPELLSFQSGVLSQSDAWAKDYNCSEADL